MTDNLSLRLSNWSIKKTLNSTDDPILKAQIIIFFCVFMLNFVKIGVILPEYLQNQNTDQIVGAIIALCVTIFVLKTLLSRPKYIKCLIHVALSATVIGMWIRMFKYDNNLSMILMQDVFMIVMWSFYGLKSRWGLFYSTIAIIPVIANLSIDGTVIATFAEPGISFLASLTIFIVNFIVILIGHYYYRNALYKTIKEKGILNNELKASNASNTLFLSTMSHELRTPLNSVIGMANLLIDDSKDHEQKENLDILKFSAESLLALINDILDFNKIGSGKVGLETISFNLKELMENACAGLRIKASEKSLYCKLNIDAELENQYVVGDPTRLLQIVYNLVGNGVKFTRNGGVEVNVNLIKKVNDMLTIRFVVQDTGLGISKDQQQYIFEPFIQASKNTTRKYGGTGLGLSIVKHLLTLHGSKIYLESELNKGAKFSFDIDYQEAVSNKDPLKVNLISDDLSDISGLRILLAEDNQMSILFMKKLLSKWGVVLAVAENGEEVIKALNEYDYDVILMDIHMPVMNGYEATKLIRKMDEVSKSKIYIVALTASVSVDVHLGAIDAGMDDSISKPFQSNELYQKLKIISSLKHKSELCNLPFE